MAGSGSGIRFWYVVLVCGSGMWFGYVVSAFGFVNRFLYSHHERLCFAWSIIRCKSADYVNHVLPICGTWFV